MEIKEELLQFIWKYRLFNLPLFDLDDLEVELVDPGKHNRDSGPDFFTARIRSEGLIWAGNIEIHRKASDWYLHEHHLDPAFDNVILHVVLEADCQVKNSRGREIRTTRLDIPPEVVNRYRLLMNNPEQIPCWRRVHEIGRNRFNRWLEYLAMERFGDRIRRVLVDFKRCSGEWHEVLYISFARAFGQKVNADPFEMLARSVSLRNILNYCPDQTSREAILFGQAGMLDAGGESGEGGNLGEGGKFGETGKSREYYTELCMIYSGLRSGLDLQPVDGFLWKFLRLRPDNFPTIRISQMACSLGKLPDLFGKLIGAEDPMKEMMRMEIRASEYWTTHYRFGQVSPAREKRIGKNRMTGLFVNAVLPVLMAYQELEGESSGGIDFPGMLMRIRPEDNRVVRIWKGMGMEVPDILASQAFLQLTDKYCRHKRCLSCYVGTQVIGR